MSDDTSPLRDDWRAIRDGLDPRAVFARDLTDAVDATVIGTENYGVLSIVAKTIDAIGRLEVRVAELEAAREAG